MLVLLKNKSTEEEISKAGKDLDKYIKFVVDIETTNLVIGGDRHYQAEQLLLENGSKQKNLWGGGYDTETKVIDYDSIINIRPINNNPSREVINMDVRNKINSILKDKLEW